MQSGALQRVQWCANRSDHFYAISAECVSLHELVPTARANSSRWPGVVVSPELSTQVVARQTELGAPKCVAPKPDDELVIAHGHANGTVNVTDLNSGTVGGRAVLPCKYSQASVHLAWNPVNTNLLASAHERGAKGHKNNNSVYVWDLQQVGQLSSMTGSGSGDYHSSTLPRASYELAAGESAVCCTWLSHKRHSLLVGLRERSGMRVFDVRDRNKPLLTMATRCIYGIAVNPLQEHYVSAYSLDRAIAVFDLRNVGANSDKPVLTINTNADINKAVWNGGSQTLCTLLAQSQYIKQQVLQKVTTSGEAELSYCDRHTYVSFGADAASRCRDTVLDFDVCPTNASCYLALSSASTLRLVHVFDSSLCRWDRDGHLVICFNKTLWDCEDLAAGDINEIMRDRATRNYGVQSGPSGLGQMKDILQHDLLSIAQRAQHCPNAMDGTQLALMQSARDALHWLSLLALLHDKYSQIKLTWPYDKVYPSVIEILHRSLPTAGGVKEHKINTCAEQRGFDDLQPKRMVYTSEERSRIIELCGWQSVCAEPAPLFEQGVAAEASQAADVFVLELARSNVGRACAIALFTLRSHLAVKILARATLDAASERTLQQREQQQEYRLTAMALGGFQAAVGGQTEAKEIWVSMCASLMSTLKDPYLHAIFDFLLVNARTPHHRPEQYATIVDSSRLPLHDRLAFACIHLPDHPLVDQLAKWTTECTERARLEGVALTGMRADSAPFVRLLQSYVDTTSDVQTAALLLIHGRCYRRSNPQQQPAAEWPPPPAQQLIETYECLLNQWQLWHARAQLDALKNRLQQYKHESVPAQVYLRCTFCSQPATSMQRGSSSAAMPSVPSSLQQGRPNRQHNGSVGACVHCNKPLPRCALCRMHMASSSFIGNIMQDQWNAGQDERPTTCTMMNNRFSNWFSWCQSCRHGGHVHHLAEWFEANTDCPVVGCKCKCTLLDAHTPFAN